MSYYERFHCQNCGCLRRFRKPTPNHRLHAMMTIATAGLWSPVWAALSWKYARRHWRCTYCRHAWRVGTLPGGDGNDWRTDDATRGVAEPIGTAR